MITLRPVSYTVSVAAAGGGATGWREDSYPISSASIDTAAATRTSRVLRDGRLSGEALPEIGLQLALVE